MSSRPAPGGSLAISRPSISRALRPKPFLEHANRRGPAGAADRSSQRNLFGADGDAILGVAAFLNAAFGHERINSLAAVVFASRIDIEQNDLANGVSTDEAAVVRFVLPPLECFFGLPVDSLQLDLEILRAGVETAAAAHALAERIHGLLRFL